MTMIKLGTESELHKIKHLQNDIQKAVCEDISILDDCYGKDRNIDADIGGFVVICNADEELNIENFDKDFEKPEFTQRICPYTKKLYLSGTERNIIIYERDL